MQLIDSFMKHGGETLPIIPFSKGETLFREGDKCLGVYLVVRGKVKIASYSISGLEIVYNQIEEGGIFGNNLVFASDPTFRGNVLSDGQGELIFIPKARLLSLLRQDEELLSKYLQVQSDFGKSLNAKLKILSFPSAEERLDYYLSLHHGEARFTSVSSFAETLFLKRETLSRLLHDLDKRGKIKLSKGKIERME